MCDEGTEDERYDYMDKVEAKIKEFATTTAPYLLILGHSPIWYVTYKQNIDRNIQLDSDK
jgi:hypothetical protein